MNVTSMIRCVLTGLVFISILGSARGEVILQFFETEWDEMYRRLPEIAEIGYGGIWHPSPAKSPIAGPYPHAGGGNVGYSMFDRFDLGQIPQRGDLRTRYGTFGSLRNMVDSAHRTDIKIYPDIIMNHAGNGPNFWTYPGMRPNDFHGWWDGNEPGGFKRAPRMSNYGEVNNGYGRTFQEELVSLIDIVTELDNRFSTGAPNYATPDEFIRQPGEYEMYPFQNPGDPLPVEHPVDFLNRWINWLGYMMDYDGVRLDAPKHVIADFFGVPGNSDGFNHNIQFNYKDRHGFSNYNNVDEMYQNDLRRRDSALIFSEFFIGDQSEVDYWDNFGVKMRYLDFPRKSQMIGPAFSGGNLAALSSFAGFSPAEGVMFAQSHDEGPPGKLELAYAYILLRVGVPIVYFTGNNLDQSDIGFRTWMLTGHGGALGDYGHQALPNLVYVHNNFARGNEWERWSDGDLYAFERHDGPNPNLEPSSADGDGILFVALNDSGGDRTETFKTSFQNGTVLKDYTGNNPNNVTVGTDGWVQITVPGMGGQGWVAYAPRNAEADGDPIRITGSNAMDWIVPGGDLADDKPRTVTRVTGDTAEINVHFFDPPDATVDSVMIKWGEGENLSTNFYDSGNSAVSGGYMQANEIGAGHWRLTVDTTGLSEGLHVIRARAFNNRAPGLPALFQTFTETVYVDRSGPDIAFANLDDSETVYGQRMVELHNADRTAYEVEYSFDGSTYFPADQTMKGIWRFALPALSAGPQTLSVRAYEADWGDPRTVINTSIVTRAFTVNNSGPAIAMAHSNTGAHAGADDIHLPFFSTTITVDPGVSQDQVRLFWDGIELAGLTGTGTITHVFDGRILNEGNERRLWGAFVNGPHVFEAQVVTGGQTNHIAHRKVFSLYGANLHDSDGDGLPDDVEMPDFLFGSNPGPNKTFPGDWNQDFIPNYGENWTHLNPMNHDTTYNGTWDGDEDWSGDGFSNLFKVRMGYTTHTNAFHYNIYDPGAVEAWWDEDAPEGTPSEASWNPTDPERCATNTLTITYEPNDGVLTGDTNIFIQVGFNNWTEDVNSYPMTDLGGGTWEYVVDPIPTNAFMINFVFRNEAGSIWDNNNNNDWNVQVTPCGGPAELFVMDGVQDSANYEIVDNGMKIWAAVRDENLYVATWTPRGGSSDHFVLVTDTFASPEAAPWGKAGQVYMNLSTKPYLAGEADNDFHTFVNGGSSARAAESATPGQVLEGELNLVEVFGAMPDTIYISALAYGNNEGDGINVQAPPYWNDNDDLETMEFQPVNLASIRDQDDDGYFDVGRPEFRSEVDGNLRNANYDIRRFFINELSGESRDITFSFRPNTDPGDTISDVELFSNLNRRDFAVMEEDRNTVSTTSQTTYFRAYEMSGPDVDGWYSVTLPVNKCGAYRATVRYRVNGGSYVYYTDNALRRDLAIVVSPSTALDLVMYEINPMYAEATDDTFAGRSTFKHLTENAFPGRPNVIDPQYFNDLGVNMLWLQPIHPIGFDGRETDESTGLDYDPGSPYAVRDYWKVNPVLGDPFGETQAMNEFTNFVHQMSLAGVGVMLDGTFNHSAWDAVIGQKAVDMFDWASDPNDTIRSVRPQWYARKNDYGLPATYFNTFEDNDVAVAPDRIDFGKWSDVAQFYFGKYDALVRGQTEEWRDQFLSERDIFFGHDEYSREVWEYFSEYPLYWLEQTGHPAGTPKEESWRGIDGLRCDFAQGLPSEFWEYTINKTRSVKWNFIFMAESLDGNRVIGGSPRHGLTYRSARHFDVLNENMVFYWREQYFAKYQGGGDNEGTPNPTTAPLWEQLDNRRNAYDLAPILLNLSGHDEIYPHNSQWRLLYAHAILGALDGVPMLMYGQEAGAQNDAATYSDVNGENNFARYEENFGKSIPNFKRYNHMTNIWTAAGWKAPLEEAYQRINNARLNSPALRSQLNYFIERDDTDAWDPDILSLVKFQQAGVSAASQDVVMVFVNHNYEGSTNRWGTFKLNAELSPGVNWFGIQPGHDYQIVDLMSPNPTNYVWGSPTSGADLIADGITVGLTGNPFEGQQAQYLRLIDITAGHNGSTVLDYFNWDADSNGLPDNWQDDVAMPGAASPDDTAPNGLTWKENFLAGTDPNNPDSAPRVDMAPNGGGLEVMWNSVPERNYHVERTFSLVNGPWSSIFFGTALNASESVMDHDMTYTNALYRVRVLP